MKRFQRNALRCCLLPLTAFAFVTAVHAEEQTRYVRDWITLPLRQTQSTESTIVYSGVSSGTELTIVKEDPSTGFTRVRTKDGFEGWIASRHLIAEPTARMQLDKLNAELAELRKTNARLEQEQANIPADQRLAAQQLTQFKSDNARLQEELQTLQQAPDNAVQLAQENIELKKNNTAMQAQLADVNQTITALQRAQNFTLFREGALAVIAGAILTVLIPRLKPKKRSEWA
ncbi:MAG: TIGR04211 family SH3 domain-containing protein [Spongiibacteraceae bacterium]